MNFIAVTKFITILGLAGALGVAPAMAQTTTGTMVPVQSPGMPHHTAPAKPGNALPKSLEFTTIAAAAAHCPAGIVVWSSLTRGHSFHTSGSRYFGKTKHGAYVCQSDALAAGFHQAKS
ncbi:hypothetical protein [Acidocella sp.]|uniref:hypothetical protein n=1 Tax=Acidocella sp. TaxID=50710 RepID=UPI00260BC227|nr:hypothetical protein [Acidocella sp.]